MDLTPFVLNVFCIPHDWLKDKRLRQRGPQPMLHDCEVLTFEIVGESLSYDEEQAIHDYFRRHWAHFFPVLSSVQQTTFAREAANLWQFLLKQINYDEQIIHNESATVARI